MKSKQVFEINAGFDLRLATKLSFILDVDWLSFFGIVIFGFYFDIGWDEQKLYTEAEAREFTSLSDEALLAAYDKNEKNFSIIVNEMDERGI